ncbi:MAG: OmpH family outer membrane protein [Treponema sp.]|nr:OmpH family outer membrane protein [Treponema sp.]
MKKKAFILFAILLPTLKIQAQQLTRFAVVDVDKVNVAFFKDSKAYRDWQDQSAGVQREIDRITKEIQDMRNAQFEADGKGDKEQALKLENDARRRSEYLREYYRTKTVELEAMKNNLGQSESFYRQVSEGIRFIAESEGYTMVLNSKDPNILWFSSSVDITDKLIQNLRSRR